MSVFAPTKNPEGHHPSLEVSVELPAQQCTYIQNEERERNSANNVPQKTLLVHIKWIMEYYVRNTARKDFPICILLHCTY